VAVKALLADFYTCVIDEIDALFGAPDGHPAARSCLVLQNNQQTSSWSITLMVVVGHGMRTGAHLAS